MAKAFKVTRRGIIGALDPEERQLLRKLFEDIIELLEPTEPANADPLAAMVGVDSEAVTPSDSAVRRLLPDAVRDDEDEALEFRRLTERSLREDKIGTLRASALLMESSPLKLTAEQARMMARALNDVRLVLADRLKIASDEDAARLHDIDDVADADADDVETYLALVYNFASWLQESLIQAMLALKDK